MHWWIKNFLKKPSKNESSECVFATFLLKIIKFYFKLMIKPIFKENSSVWNQSGILRKYQSRSGVARKGWKGSVSFQAWRFVKIDEIRAWMLRAFDILEDSFIHFDQKLSGIVKFCLQLENPFLYQCRMSVIIKKTS